MNLAAVLSLNTSRFLGPLGGAMGKLAAFAGVSVSVGAAVAGVKRAFDFGGQLSDLSAVTGASVKDLTVLRQAFDDTGVGAEQVKTAISFMQRSFSGMNEDGGRTADVFKSLGLDMEQLRGMSAADAMQKIGGAIGGLGSEADKTAATMAIFGRNGAMLKSFFADPAAIETARKSLGGLPDIMQRNAQLFDSISDAMGRVKAKGMGLFAGIAEGVAPALKGVTDALDGIDFAAIGVKIGEAIGTGLELIRSGRLSDLLILAFKIGAKGAINALANVPLILGTAILAVLGNLALWKGIGQLALAGFMGLGAGLLKLFTEPLKALQAGIDWVIDQLFGGLSKIPGVSKLLGLEGYESKSFADHYADAATGGLSGFLTRQADASAEIAAGLAGKAMDNLKSGAAQAVDIVRNYDPVSPFDLDADKASLADMWRAAGVTAADRRDAIQEQFAPKPAGGGAMELEKSSKGGGKGFSPSSDSLARIGFFVGGSGGLVDPMRRTASGIDRMLRHTERIAKNTEKGSGAPAAVWA